MRRFGTVIERFGHDLLEVIAINFPVQHREPSGIEAIDAGAKLLRPPPRGVVSVGAERHT